MGEGLADGLSRAEVMVLSEKLIEACWPGGGDEVDVKFCRGRGGRATRRGEWSLVCDPSISEQKAVEPVPSKVAFVVRTH